jgi:HPt (histidine-containing phosphotransfer) domain-containing protein
LPGFIKTRAEDMTKLKAALADADFDTVSQLGHKMKGSSASYGFKDAAEFSKQLEEAAKNKDLDLCRGLAASLEEVFARLGQPRGQSPQPDLL